VGGWQANLAAPSSALITTTIPSPFTVLPGSVLWVIFVKNVALPVVYQTTMPPSGCTGTAGTIGDGQCDPANNNPPCGYDGGDCCATTCLSSSTYTCGVNGYLCLTGSNALLFADPTYPPTPAPSGVAGSPTPAPSTAQVATVKVSQTIGGVSQAEAAR
jgi:hypothetical protein